MADWSCDLLHPDLPGDPAFRYDSGRYLLAAQIILSGIDQATSLEETIDFSVFPFGEYLEQIDIDWVQLKINIEKWTLSQRDVLLKQAAGTVSSIAKGFMNFFIDWFFPFIFLQIRRN